MKKKTPVVEKAPPPANPNRFGILNIPHHVCQHLVGEQHTATHRMMVGAIIMISGVYSIQLFEFHTLIFRVVADVVGYGVHGIGLIPFADYLSQAVKKES